MEKAFVRVGGWLHAPGEISSRAGSGSCAAPAAPAVVSTSEQESGPPLWQRVWRARLINVVILLIAIGVLTAIFFFHLLVKRPVLYERIRIGFLSFTLLWLGWSRRRASRW